MPDIVPTRTALLELREEREGIREGYRFLDEKRTVLAGEILHELERYARLREDFARANGSAREALKAALARHGLEGLQVYPAAGETDTRLERDARMVLGLRLQDLHLAVDPAPAPAAERATAQAETCRERFLALLQRAVELGGSAANLERLQHEYQRTARRARAIEDVLLPELDQAIADIDLALEDQDREEAVRMRFRTSTALVSDPTLRPPRRRDRSPATPPPGR